MLASVCPKSRYKPFFDQVRPIADIKGLIAKLDLTRENKPESCACVRGVFECNPFGFLSVQIYAPYVDKKQSSIPAVIWPTGGTTHQIYASTTDEISSTLKDCWAPLVEICNQRNWRSQ